MTVVTASNTKNAEHFNAKGVIDFPQHVAVCIDRASTLGESGDGSTGCSGGGTPPPSPPTSMSSVTMNASSTT
jgi:hypothetical protein